MKSLNMERERGLGVNNFKCKVLKIFKRWSGVFDKAKNGINSVTEN